MHLVSGDFFYENRKDIINMVNLFLILEFMIEIYVIYLCLQESMIILLVSSQHKGYVLIFPVD